MGKGAVRVVEYLENSISEELLSKFPQYNTTCSSSSDPTLDFNYSESSIWSPLVKPHFPPLKNYNYEKQKNISNKKKKKLTLPSRKPTVVQNLNVDFNNLIKQRGNKKKKRSGDLFDSSPAPHLPASYSPFPKKRWANILKVGPKCFKKTSKKKDHTVAHISLSNCFHTSMF